MKKNLPLPARLRPVMLAACLIACAGAGAQDGAPALDADSAQVDKVKVAGMRDPEFKTYKDFAAGLDAFDARRALAPAAALRFSIHASGGGGGGGGIEGLSMRIAGNETSIAVPIAPDGSFAIPRSQAALDEDAEIMLNRKKGGFRWRPDVRSPGVPPGARRLGDLRMECEVRWAVEKREMSFIKRTSFSAMGGPCKASMVSVIQYAGKPLAGYTLVAGERRQRNAAKSAGGGDIRYIVPLHDSTWPDETLVEFLYAEGAAGEPAPAAPAAPGDAAK